MPEALRHLDLIRNYVGYFDPVAADRLAGRLLDVGNSLSHFPNRGRPGPDGTRELPTVPPYVVSYEVTGGAVYILRIRHGRTQPED
ncbi:type II toxin-antitoxin system RelE/ParE family toxin [Sphingosinicella sp. YJ22]|uniref:type II toxin-antitoxin system RelE/ParE family toxin n=1 Tax=Sphingosinicella sp. YJ22 TaxID=1104780 RepID=UPI001A9C6C33|nr:type II toxin-antitoxin system RelE/ParE family toxin [Sphingosinicella sp. YJ22]